MCFSVLSCTLVSRYYQRFVSSCCFAINVVGTRVSRSSLALVPKNFSYSTDQDTKRPAKVSFSFSMDGVGFYLALYTFCRHATAFLDWEMQSRTDYPLYR